MTDHPGSDHPAPDRPAPGQDAVAPDVTAAVVAHMNADHADDCLTICLQQLGGAVPTGSHSARLAGYDRDAARFVLATAAGEVDVVVPWSGPLRTRADVRRELVRLVQGGAGPTGG